jgi:hypothetical protein
MKALVDAAKLAAFRASFPGCGPQTTPPHDAARQPGSEPTAGAGASPSVDEAAALPVMLSAPDLAKRLKLPLSRVESCLRRFRDRHRDCCEEVENRRRNEPRYLYRTADVLPVLQRLAKAE